MVERAPHAAAFTAVLLVVVAVLMLVRVDDFELEEHPLAATSRQMTLIRRASLALCMVTDSRSDQFPCPTDPTNRNSAAARVAHLARGGPVIASVDWCPRMAQARLTFVF